MRASAASQHSVERFLRVSAYTLELVPKSKRPCKNSERHHLEELDRVLLDNSGMRRLAFRRELLQI